MSSINVSCNISIHFENDEKEILIKSFDILKELRHELFLKDCDSDEYWCIDGTMNGLRDILKDAGISVKGY